MTVFYYDRLPPAVAFYEQAIGFEKVLDLGWVAIFRIEGRSFLTLVDAVGGSQRPISGDNKGAIVSIETDDLDGWRRRLRAAGVAGVDAPLIRGCDGRSVEFHLRDPGGYVMEIFEWCDPPPGWSSPA